MCYDQYKQQYELPKAWKDKKHDIMNQQEEELPTSPFPNAAKNFQRKYFHSHKQNNQGGGRPVNLGTKKFGDIPREPLK
jgi:hypothetical protein